MNAGVFALADDQPFLLPDRSLAPIDDVFMDRPYCTLIYDEGSRNLFVCGYSGVDLPGPRFRKNATDSILRFDLRTREWYPVELHDQAVVPEEDLGYVVSNEHYPHHDPAANPAPHGWPNGPGRRDGDWRLSLLPLEGQPSDRALRAGRDPPEPQGGLPRERTRARTARAPFEPAGNARDGAPGPERGCGLG